MRKKISEMTPEDKASFLEATKRAFLYEQGIPWEEIAPQIQDDIDASFDDERFQKMEPGFKIDAMYARLEFGNKKPDIVDYLLWSHKFVMKTEWVEW